MATTISNPLFLRSAFFKIALCPVISIIACLLLFISMSAGMFRFVSLVILAANCLYVYGLHMAESCFSNSAVKKSLATMKIIAAVGVAVTALAFLIGMFIKLPDISNPYFFENAGRLISKLKLIGILYVISFLISFVSIIINLLMTGKLKACTNIKSFAVVYLSCLIGIIAIALYILGLIFVLSNSDSGIAAVICGLGMLGCVGSYILWIVGWFKCAGECGVHAIEEV